MSGRLNKKVSIITGAASGIGEATAKLFSNEGSKVIIADLNSIDGKKIIKEIKENGGDGLFIKTDVSKEADCKKVMDTTAKTYGKIDILVNNAATMLPNASFLQLSGDDFDKIMAINVKGVFYCCKHAIPYMKQNGGGAIVTLSSRSAFIPFPSGCSVAYNASKAACLSLTITVAQEFGKDGIRANVIIPSNVRTATSEKVISSSENSEAVRKFFENSQPIGRAGETIEIAEAILWLASDKSSFVTSAPILIDGGFFFAR